MKLNFLVEGQTEETFVNNVLRPHLNTRSIRTSVRCVITSVKDGHPYRGGINNYDQPRRDMQRWMNDEPDDDTRFTTMFDLYRLPTSFPGHSSAMVANDAYDRVDRLERAMSMDMGDLRLIPHIQLHEFESMILADPEKLVYQFPDYGSKIKKIVDMANTFRYPELIDADDPPSKRIIREIPEYEYMKASAGPIVVAHIGLMTLRRRCIHLNSWIDALESLA